MKTKPKKNSLFLTMNVYSVLETLFLLEKRINFCFGYNIVLVNFRNGKRYTVKKVITRDSDGNENVEVFENQDDFRQPIERSE